MCSKQKDQYGDPGMQNLQITSESLLSGSHWENVKLVRSTLLTILVPVIFKEVEAGVNRNRDCPCFGTTTSY